jgi:hypothetical protein
VNHRLKLPSATKYVTNSARKVQMSHMSQFSSLIPNPNMLKFCEILIYLLKSGTRLQCPPDPEDHKIANATKICSVGETPHARVPTPQLGAARLPSPQGRKKALVIMFGPLRSVAGPFRGPQIRQLSRSPAATTPHHWVLRVASCFA